MEIKLIRKYYQAKYTIGRLYVNNRFFSDSLEPPSLHLTERSALGTILLQNTRDTELSPQGVIASSSHAADGSDDGCRCC